MRFDAESVVEMLFSERYDGLTVEDFRCIVKERYLEYQAYERLKEDKEPLRKWHDFLVSLRDTE